MREKKNRLFVAVNLPEKTKNGIAAFLESIPKDGWGKVRQENLHITLCFLGWIEESKLNEIKTELEKLSGFGEFEMELNGFGHFDGRVLWIGIGKGAEELNALSKKTGKLLGAIDERFHAHITLARNKGAKRKYAAEIIEKLRKTAYREKIIVKSIDLMESRLQTIGPVYRKLFEASLT